MPFAEHAADAPRDGNPPGSQFVGKHPLAGSVPKPPTVPGGSDGIQPTWLAIRFWGNVESKGGELLSLPR
jgi:hypothetical protein